MPGGRAVSRIGGAPANASLRIKLSGGCGYEPLGAPALEPYYEPWCEPLQLHNQQQRPYNYRVYPDRSVTCEYGGSSDSWGGAEAYVAQQPPPWQQGRLTVTVQQSGEPAPAWQQQKHYQAVAAPWQQQEQYQAVPPWQQQDQYGVQQHPWQHPEHRQGQPPWQQQQPSEAPPSWQQQPQQHAPPPCSSSVASVSAAPAHVAGEPAASSKRPGSDQSKQSSGHKARLPTPPPDVHARAHMLRAAQQQKQESLQAAQQKQAAPRQNPPVLKQKPVLVQQAQQAQQQQQQQQQREAAKAAGSGSSCSPWREPLSPPPASSKQLVGPADERQELAASNLFAAKPASADRPGSYKLAATPMPAAASPLLADYTPAPPPTNGGQAQPAGSACTSSSAGPSPVVPDFIQRLWREREEGQQAAQQAKQAQQEPATPEAPLSSRPGSAVAPAAAPPSAGEAAPAGNAAVAEKAPQESAGTLVATAAAAAEKEAAEVEEGELVGQCASSCTRERDEVWREPLPPPPQRRASAGGQACSSYSHSSSRGGGASAASRGRRRDASRERYRSRSRGRHGSRYSGHSRRGYSSSRSSSRGRRSSSSECESRRRGGRNRGGRQRRRSRSPLRRVGRRDACGKRHAAAVAAPPPADAPLALASLVESMAAEAASLQRQLGRLTVNDDDMAADNAKAAPTASGGSAGAAVAAPASKATSQTTAAAKAADVESQLAALSSKLGQLTLCLQTMQQQPVGAAGGSAEQRERSSDSEAGRFYIVFDTNVFMDHSRMIKHDCWKAIVAAGSTATRILVPLEVMRELDGIKKCFFRGFWAQRAIRRLESMQGHAALRGQREDERYHGLLRRNDDGILDCCLLFRARGAQIQLVSKDVCVRVRARNEGIPCCLPADVLPLLKHRLELEGLQP